MTIAVEVHANVHMRALTREALTKIFFGIGDVLTDVEAEFSDILDHAVSVDLGQELVTIDVTARAESAEEAELLAKAAVLLAMKATGGKPSSTDALMHFVRGGSPAVVEELSAHDINIVSRELVIA